MKNQILVTYASCTGFTEGVAELMNSNLHYHFFNRGRVVDNDTWLVDVIGKENGKIAFF
jgi:hypothetical protein